MKINNEVYNLQIPISKDLEKKLRICAKLDDRTIRAFCRRVLQAYADNSEIDFNSIEVPQTRKPKEKNKEEIPKVETKNDVQYIPKKKTTKVGMLSSENVVK